MALQQTRNLYEASSQWMNRPPDERFWNIPEMRAKCFAYAESAYERTTELNKLRVRADESDIVLHGSKHEALLTHHAAGQICRLANAPANYIRTLPTDLAADCINTGLNARDEYKKLNILLHKNGRFIARAVTTDSYDRVWNYQICDELLKLTKQGWRVPPARPSPRGGEVRIATQADILKRQGDFGLAVKVGDKIGPAGLYASDHDMFAFLVNEDLTVEDNGKLLARGAFVKNSEVGDGAIWFTLFLYDFVCGNHIVWDARQVQNIRVAHKKARQLETGFSLDRAIDSWQDTIKALPPPNLLETQIKAARNTLLGDNQDETVEVAYKFAKSRNLNRLTQTVLVDAYGTEDRYGDPNSVWSLVNGITLNSQRTGYTDDRNELDRQAGRLMEMAN